MCLCCHRHNTISVQQQQQHHASLLLERVFIGVCVLNVLSFLAIFNSIVRYRSMNYKLPTIMKCFCEHTGFGVLMIDV